MIEFVNHVNKCKTCGIVPNMYTVWNDTVVWKIICSNCGRTAEDQDSIRVIQSWNIYNPEPEKVRA